MQVTEIEVSAGRTFNHPYESYSNFRPHITLRASLTAGEDPEAAAKLLQGKAEQLMDDHKENTLKKLREEWERGNVPEEPEESPEEEEEEEEEFGGDTETDGAPIAGQEQETE